jgi:4-hydroxy-3-polyprenylbenzoate decarboxylase
LKCQFFQQISFFLSLYSAFVIRHSLRPDTIVGIPPMGDFYIGGTSVRFFLPIFKMNFLGIADIALPEEASAEKLSTQNPTASRKCPSDN